MLISSLETPNWLTECLAILRSFVRLSSEHETRGEMLRTSDTSDLFAPHARRIESKLMEGKKKLAVTLVPRADFPVIITKKIKALNFENFAVKLNAWTQRLNSYTKAGDNVEVGWSVEVSVWNE